MKARFGVGSEHVDNGTSTIFITGLLTQNKELRPGDKVDFVPSHCCTTVNLYDYMYVVRDEIVEAIWPITARGAH